jgi:hypothetical protein
MRTYLLGAMWVCMAFGQTQTPKPDTIPVLSTAEKIALSTIVSKSKELADQQKALQEQFNAIQREACQAHHKQDACQITDAGQIIPTPAKPAPAKPEAAK